MVTLTGFADEIGPDLELQVRTLQAVGLRHLELRGIWGANVLDLSAAQRREACSRLQGAGIGVSAIGSPIGKVRIDEPWADHVERFRIALDAAEYFGAPFIRLFSYYPPKGGGIAEHRDEVIRRLNEQVEMARGRPVQLLHENEREIYGEGPEAYLDIARNVPGMKLVFDPANLVVGGVRPREAWRILADHVVYFHIKDARLSDGGIVPAGEGDGDVEAILRDAILARGFGGFLSLEPHLAAAGQFSGFSGPDLFRKAVEALRAILTRLGVEVA
jgi:sugar phosphate isomerase/epimerase